MSNHKEIPTQLDETAVTLVRRMCEKRPDAGEWLISVAESATHWDHVVDGDPVDCDRFSAAMLAVVVGWGFNPWFREHASILSVVSLNAFLAWRTSDSNRSLRCKAYDVVTEIGTTVALLVGGPAHAIEWSPRLREWSLRKMAENDAAQKPEV